MITRLFLICTLCLSVVPASADDPAQANRLLVEAAQLFRQANQAGTTERLALLESAFAKLNEIIKRHPSSELAVQLITEQPIGFLSLGSLARAVSEEQFRAGKLQNAFISAQLIADIRIRDEMLAEIAPTQARAGDVQDALTTAKMLSENKVALLADVSFRDAVLGQIAEIQAGEKGDIQGAKATLGMIRNIQFRDQLLVAVQRNEQA